MTTPVSPKCRLVRCPKCWQVLGELPEVSVYKCGGCGAVLQAKIRKMEGNHPKFSSQATDSAAKAQDDDVSKEDDTRNLNHYSTSSLEESLSGKDDVKYVDKHGERSTELSEERNVYNDFCSPPEAVRDANEDSQIIVKELLYSKGYDNKSNDSDKQSAGGGDFYGEFAISNELVYHETKDLSSETKDSYLKAGEYVEEYDKGYFDRSIRVDQLEGIESFREGMKNNYVRLYNDEAHANHFTNQKVEFYEGIKDAGANPASSEIVSHENGYGLLSTELGTIVHDIKGTPRFTRSSSGKYSNPIVVDPTAASPRDLEGGILPVNLMSLDYEDQKYTPRNVSRNLKSASCMELFESSHRANASLALILKHGNMTSSPTTRSYYANFDSESSYNESDYQMSVHIPHRSRRKVKDVDHSSNTAVVEEDGFRKKNMLNCEPNYWAPSSLDFQGNPHHAMNMMRLDGGVLQSPFTSREFSRSPFMSRELHSNRRTEVPSTYRHKFPPPYPDFHSSDSLYSESENMKLLQTVCELKDQLNRIQLPKISRSKRFPAEAMKEKLAPFYYDPLTSKRDIMYRDLNHPKYYVRPGQEKYLTERSNFSRSDFSGEAESIRLPVYCSCLHGCTHDHQYSAHSPSHALHYRNDRSVVYTGHNHFNICSSSSPQQYSSSELLLRSNENKFDNQSRRDGEAERLFLRNKLYTAKKHLLPIAGGSPFVVCYHCSKLLQLPADFILSKKKYHLLRCHNCSKVLKFSLMKRTHIVPHLLDASSVPPFCETGGYTDATNQGNAVSIPLSSSCQHVEAVSCSDDHGRSLYRSCSSESEVSVVLPSLGLVDRSEYNGKMPSCSSYETVEDMKMKSILKESMDQHEIKSSVETLETVGSSSEFPMPTKASSDLEELAPSTNPPLHWLMGYASPNILLN